MNDLIKDKITKLAFSLHSSPGVYALLLGSGISRDAGIPTGWEIVLNLIQKIAAIESETPEPDPETWYRNRFGEVPDYSKILDRLTIAPTERANLLRSYFEPTEEELEQGLKTPTQAHKAIATLVKYGYIRMILTTNFDRLIEKALEKQGITPDVISTDDALKGAMPYVHSKCTVVKLHGDYMDTRIKNTAKELSHYSDKLNAYLDRIFDDFGLIICGWSGKWDIALRNAILRCKNRRFPTYWLAKGKLTDETKETQRIIQHRRAEVILIDNADHFFIELLEKIESLREFEKPHPLSVPLAIATVKRYLADEKHYIRLHDLVTEETERVSAMLSSDRFKTKGIKLSKDVFQKRLYEYEELIKTLVGMLTTLAYFDKGNNAYLLTKATERIVQPLEEPGHSVSVDLQYYPVLLLVYATGISALVRRKYDHLAAVLLTPEYHEFPYVLKKLSNHFQKYTSAPASNHIFDILREPLRSYLPIDEKYMEFFDIFEYLLGLVHIWMRATGEPPYGCFGWRYCRDKDWISSPIQRFIQQGKEQSKRWGLLKAGFFDGSINIFEDCNEEYENFLKPIRHNCF